MRPAQRLRIHPVVTRRHSFPRWKNARMRVYEIKQCPGSIPLGRSLGNHCLHCCTAALLHCCTADLAVGARVGAGVDAATVVSDVTSIIVDQKNRKSLLLFMVGIRQHLFNALPSLLSTFPPRTGTGERGCTVRIVPNKAWLRQVSRLLHGRSGLQAPPWTGVCRRRRKAGFLDGPRPQHTTTESLDCDGRKPCHWSICATC